ncbi:guanylate kinase [Synechococcus sp. PCC 7502]|uniref:guanylate kinase n=1 Tax=Synechococcus sp. PCC 7502 TaxID=1173263 RepID=UPI00029FE44C|nr:guanylate kinase [Synechococcus sp. PCC 7502]AFY74212.1 guanylate kinase [Synechococcus sp. PCC 7502]
MSYQNKKGKLLVVTGPSGVGKGTLLNALATKYPEQFVFSVSGTTRPPRDGETDGVNYFFYSRTEFEQKQAACMFLEWAEYAGNLYGTPREPVEAAIAQAKIVILEIELKGARQISQSYPDAQKIFIAPPSMQVLEQRLRQRSQDDESAIARRLDHAQVEIAASGEFDQVIINNDLATALAELEQAIFNF